MWRALAWSFVAPLVIAFTWGAAMMYVAWQHNPQEEFHGTGVIHWSEWLAVGLIHFAFAFVAALPLVAIVWLALRLISPARRNVDGT